MSDSEKWCRKYNQKNDLFRFFGEHSDKIIYGVFAALGLLFVVSQYPNWIR